jgi:hypothetical protein
MLNVKRCVVSYLKNPAKTSENLLFQQKKLHKRSFSTHFQAKTRNYWLFTHSDEW